MGWWCCVYKQCHLEGAVKQGIGVGIRRLVIDFRWVTVMGRKKDKIPWFIFYSIIVKYLFIFGHASSQLQLRGSRACEFSNCGWQAWLPHKACRILVPPSEIEPASPALVGGQFLTTGPPGKSQMPWFLMKATGDGGNAIDQGGEAGEKLGGRWWIQFTLSVEGFVGHSGGDSQGGGGYLGL